MDFWSYISLFGAALLGGGLAFYLRKDKWGLLPLMLSFSGAYILGITFLHLIPDTYGAKVSNVGVFVLVGFLIQLILEQLSKGVEHGHIHVLKTPQSSIAVSIMIGLCIHAFIEGMPLSGYTDLHHHAEHHHGEGHNHGGKHHLLLYSILLHKIPAAFALVIFFLLSNYNKKIIAFCLILFASMSPLGALLAAFLTEQGILSKSAVTVIMAIVIGSFFHIATTILFESDSGHQHTISFKKLTAILLGLGIAYFTVNGF